MRKARENYPSAKEGIGDCVRICGNFTTAGAGAVTVFSSGPFTVVRASQGTYTVTFRETFNEILAINVGLAGATNNANRALNIAASNSPGTATAYGFITIETQSVVGTNADLTGPVVHFEVIYRKGKLKI